MIKYYKDLANNNFNVSEEMNQHKIISDQFRPKRIEKNTRISKRTNYDRIEIEHPKFPFYRLKETDYFAKYDDILLKYRDDKMKDDNYGRYKETIKSIITIQRFIRKIDVLIEEKYTSSVKKIQKSYKSYKLRKYMKNYKKIKAINIIKKKYHIHYIKRKLPYEYKKMLIQTFLYYHFIIPHRINKIILIQRIYRGYKGRNDYKKIKAGNIIWVIYNYRKYHKQFIHRHGKLEELKKKRANRIICNAIYKYNQETTVKRYIKKLTQSTIKIQSCYRGYLCRKDLIPMLYRVSHISLKEKTYYNYMLKHCV